MNDNQFKTIISASLPDSWQSFVEPYETDVDDEEDDESDSKKSITAENFIGVIREQYTIRQNRKNNGAVNGTNPNGTKGESYVGKTPSGKKSLAARISDKKKPGQPYCEFCKRLGHWTSDCKRNPLAKVKCYNCGRYGHYSRDCKAKRDKDRDKGGGKGEKKGDNEKKGENSNAMEVAFVTEDGEFYNFDVDSTNNDERLIWYEWLADNATSSHVCNYRDSFVSYEPLHDVSVTGVGGKVSEIKGVGTVKLIASCDENECILTLKDVLHVPNQPYNLISLGRWDQIGGTYIGTEGMLTLVNCEGAHIAKGKRLKNNLSRMYVQVYKEDGGTMGEAFVANKPPASWETWHRRFGHVGYTGLQKLLDGNIVEGFEVDKNTPKVDCIACTEAKQHVEPFPKSTNRQTEAGELTHIDLWGKYAVQSINGNKYYLAMVDDAKRYVTVNFCKEKTEAAQLVINYLAHQIANGRIPRAIQIDRGKEFVNQKLRDWCSERGIELRLTAPYSPSQNGVAERMNRTLEELARAMLASQRLPEFLWEHATLHAGYIRNRSYNSFLETETPYEGWFERKPNVAHLREFGAPVWILLQGQHKDRKMLPKSKRQIYVGYDDGSKSVKFYNAETRNVLISRNYRIINPPLNPEPPEDVELAPKELGGPSNVRHEGESGDSMPQLDQTSHEPPNKKRRTVEVEEVVDVDAPRTTRGVRPDYKHLNDPFQHSNFIDEDEDSFVLDQNETYAIIAGDELTSLSDARRSPDWPTWNQSMDEEMKTLTDMGTWELIDKPPDAVLIPNKWTFVKKRNKEGEIVRHKARLVVKGCAQHPGQYMETYSLVV